MASKVDEHFVPTKCSKWKEPHNFKIIKFQPHQKVKKQQQNLKSEHVSSNEVDMKKARFEIYKFSKTGLNYSSRQKSNIELAIQLGGKPPKKVAKNYKQLLADKKEEASLKEEERFCKDIRRNFTAKMKNKNQQSRKFNRVKNKENGILNIYGKVKPPMKKR